jgi:putative glutamine amidotransferase
MPALPRQRDSVSAPRIGITGTTRRYDGADRSTVNAAYVRSVIGAGGIPLVLPPLLGDAYAGEVIGILDGLVLSGGEDVDPAHYGQEPHPTVLDNIDPLRDAQELALFRLAQARGVPVLAICRGIQLVNVALGGTLWQDLPTERPEALRHNQPDGRTARTHAVEISPGSRLAQALAAVRIEVNSFHHQSIRDPARGLVISARAPDGEIEGIESAEGAPWLLAVQWHPEEFHAQSTPPDHGLFAALVQASLRRVSTGVMAGE